MSVQEGKGKLKRYFSPLKAIALISRYGEKGWYPVRWSSDKKGKAASADYETDKKGKSTDTLTHLGKSLYALWKRTQ